MRPSGRRLYRARRRRDDHRRADRLVFGCSLDLVYCHLQPNLAFPGGLGSKCRARQTTAIRRVPMPKKPPTSTTAARAAVLGRPPARPRCGQRSCRLARSPGAPGCWSPHPDKSASCEAGGAATEGDVSGHGCCASAAAPKNAMERKKPKPDAGRQSMPKSNSPHIRPD